MSARITKVYLLNTPLENDYKHTLYFNSREGQIEYFKSKIVHSFEDFSYQRKEGYIRVPKGYDELTNCNYLMYQNSAYSNKWFFAFITEIKYISDDVSHIYFETDCIQTWYFDYKVMPSFVEREHVLDDTVGIHTIPEGLELGEYVSNGKESANFSSAHPVIATTWGFEDEKQAGSLINGIYHGAHYYLMKEWQGIQYFLNFYADKGKSDSIIGIFMAPDSLTRFNEFSTHNEDPIHWDYLSTTGGFNYYPYKRLNGEDLGLTGAKDMGNISILKPTSLNGYIPKNKKLLTFPYNYLMGSNNNGGSAIYQYEHFSTNPCIFNTKGAITPGCSIRTVPLNYKNESVMYEEGINHGKYPICSYTTDIYTNWLTQNSVNIGLSVASSTIGILGGVAMLGTGAGAIAGGSSIANGAMGIANSIGQVYQHSLIPPQAEGNQNCGDVVYSSGNTNLTFYKMSIKQEYAKIIDKYFDMFGYKVNMVKTPNIHHRARYWYIKTIDVNIDGHIPTKDIQVIKNAYNNGITFWRNGNEIGNYALDNYISNIV